MGKIKIIASAEKVDRALSCYSDSEGRIQWSSSTGHPELLGKKNVF